MKTIYEWNVLLTKFQNILVRGRVGFDGVYDARVLFSNTVFRRSYRRFLLSNLAASLDLSNRTSRNIPALTHPRTDISDYYELLLIHP